MPKEIPQESLSSIQQCLERLAPDKPSFAETVFPRLELLTLNTKYYKLNYRGDRITKIRGILNHAGGGFYIQDIQFELSLANGTKFFCSFKNNPALSAKDKFDYSNSLHGSLIRYGWFNASHRNKHKARFEDWGKRSLSVIYQGGVAGFYNGLYQRYRDEMRRHLPAGQPVLLVEPGCGDGRCSHYLKSELRERDVSAVGFDINSDNVKVAQSRFPESRSLFEACNFADVATFVSRLKTNFYNLHDMFKVVIFSGVLAQGVAENQLTALKLLQNLARINPEIIIIAGYTNSLIGRKESKYATGMRVDYKPVDPLPPNYAAGQVYPSFMSPIAMLTKESDPDKNIHPQRLIKRSDKRSPRDEKNNLDLSLSCNPIADLESLVEYCRVTQGLHDRLAGVTQLDLSHCLINEDEHSRLIQLLRSSLPGLEKILFAPTDKFTKVLASKIKQYYPNARFYLRGDSNETELPVFSVATARRYGLFKSPVTSELRVSSMFLIKHYEEGVSYDPNDVTKVEHSKSPAAS